jgi:aromatic-L-amino-acid decarboxylase
MSTTPPPDRAGEGTRPLGDMPADSFREAGYRIIDRIADYLERGPEAPILPQLEPGEISARLAESAPASGRSIDELLDDFDSILYPGLTHWNDPRFMAYFPSSASGPAILGDLLATAMTQNVMLWRTGPAGTELELRVLDWFRQMLGLPAGFHGHIVDTASIATFLALAAAREAHTDLGIRLHGASGRDDVPRLTVYTSEEAHSSVEKGAITLGIGLDQFRKIPTDRLFRMRPELLEEAIVNDLDAGFHPLAVTATIGTTSSTSIDPVPEIADICGTYNLWLHVDAAYGGVAAIVPEKQVILSGCDRADSLVVNPHKWLFTPVDCSTFYTRRPEVLKSAFSLMPEYLSSSLDEEEALTNLMDFGIQLGRRFRALKLWMVLSYFGSDGLADRLRYHLRLATDLAIRIEDQEGVELMAPVTFATVCFRFLPDGVSESSGMGEAADDPAYEARLEAFNSEIMNRANASGEVFLSHTKLKGRYTLRLVFGHLRSSERDVEEVWDLLTRLAAEQEGSV